LNFNHNNNNKKIINFVGSSPYGKRLLENCTPQRVLPMLHFHGTDDKLVDYNDAVLTIEYIFSS